MKLRSASTPAVSTDLRVITVRLVSGTCGGAWVGGCRRRQGAVRVMDCQCRRIEVGKFLLVGLISPFLN